MLAGGERACNPKHIMNIITLIVAVTVGLDGLSALAADTNEPVQLFMPDGQLKSHPLRVFVDRDITASMKPMLKLTESHAVTRQNQSELQAHPAMLLARHQKSVQLINGQEVSFTGNSCCLICANVFIFLSTKRWRG